MSKSEIKHITKIYKQVVKQLHVPFYAAMSVVRCLFIFTPD